MLDSINKRKNIFLISILIINILLAIFWFCLAIPVLFFVFLFALSDSIPDENFITILEILFCCIPTFSLIYSFVLFAKLKKKAELSKKDLIISITMLFINLLPIIIAILIYT